MPFDNCGGASEPNGSELNQPAMPEVRWPWKLASTDHAADIVQPLEATVSRANLR